MWPRTSSVPSLMSISWFAAEFWMLTCKSVNGTDFWYPLIKLHTIRRGITMTNGHMYWEKWEQEKQTHHLKTKNLNILMYPVCDSLFMIKHLALPYQTVANKVTNSTLITRGSLPFKYVIIFCLTDSALELGIPNWLFIAVSVRIMLEKYITLFA